jgi:hypothetical protein
LRVSGDFFGKELQCDEPVEQCILGLIDHTHATATEFFKDAKVRDGLAEEWLGLCHFAGY